MNILLVKPAGGAIVYILRGLQKAFSHVGYNVEYWDGTDQQIKRFKPHVYIGCSGHKQDFPMWAKHEIGTKTAYHVNPYGNNKLKHENGWPDINEPLDTVKWVVNQNPDFVFCYGYRGAINNYWDGWVNNYGIRVYGVPTAGDCFSFYKVQQEQSMICDAAFVGGYWPYKAINIDKYLEPVRKKYNTIIYGWGGWDGRSKGPIDDSTILKLFSSAKIGPCISEPHTAVYGIDIPERIFKVSLCGLMAVSDPVSSLSDYFPLDVMPMASNPDEYCDMVGYYLSHESERICKANKQKIHILKNHTYLNRIMTIMTGFGFIKESIMIQKSINDFVKDNI